MVKEALVVKREVLLADGDFQGFIPIAERNLIDVILHKHHYHERGDKLENDDSLKQIIPYVWIVNPKTKKAFVYQRGKNQNGHSGEHEETRYLGKYSGGVGGHIDRDTEEGSDNPIIQAMARELREEVEIAVYPTPKFVGYINDDSDRLGSVHFGLVAIAETHYEVKSRVKEGLISGRFYDVKEIDSMMGDSNFNFENWTKISWPFIKDYLQKL